MAYRTERNEAVKEATEHERKAKQAKPVIRFKGADVEAADELAETLANDHGWTVDKNAIKKAGTKNGNAVKPICVRNGEKGRKSAMLEVWHTGAGMLAGELPEGVELNFDYTV